MTSIAVTQRRDSGFGQYLHILLRRRWLILATMILAVAATLYSNATTVRLYRATGTIEIAREADRVIANDDTMPRGATLNPEFYQTQYGLLKSRSLAEMVVRRLNLTNDPMFMHGYGDGPDVDGTSTRKQAEQRAASQLLKHLKVEPTRASSLVAISFDSPDPDLSARIVNTLADSFIQQNLDRRFAATGYARRYLEDRINATRAQLEESERKVVDYASAQRIIGLDAPTPRENSGTNAGPSLVGSELSALNQALMTARADRIAAQARYEKARKHGALGASEGLSDQSIAALRTSRANLMGEYSKLLAQFEPEYPPVLAVKNQIDEIDRQLRAEGRNILTALRSNYESAAARETRLQAQVDGLKQGVIDLRRRSIQYNIYQRDADTNRSLYDALLQRYKEIGVSGGVGTNNVSVVDAALPNPIPVAPRNLLNLLLALGAGMVAGIGIAFLAEQLDQSITVPEDLESQLGIPLLGTIPHLKEPGDILAALEDRRTPIAEAYLSLFTALRLTTNSGAPRVVFLTSAQAAEGKSSTSIALTHNFAQVGKKVLLIEADMRNPSIHQMLNLSNGSGLSDALTGTDDLNRLIQMGPHDLMSVMTTGPMPPNPADLLAGGQLARIIDLLLDQYDHIVIDGPPVVGLADAPLIANLAEATLFVVASKHASPKVARMSLRRLADVKAQIIGSALTKFDAGMIGYRGAYSYANDHRSGGGSRFIRRFLRG